LRLGFFVVDSGVIVILRRRTAVYKKQCKTVPVDKKVDDGAADLLLHHRAK
jgi:hypothetical protein